MSILNQLTIEKSKWLGYGLAIGATVAAVYLSHRNPAVVEKERIKVVTKTVEVVKYKDRVKVVTRVITKPDGTRIDETTTDETHSGSRTRKDEKRTDNSKTYIRALPLYSLSVLCDVRSCSDFRSYNLLAGVRLGQLPLNLELGGGFNGVLVGVRYDF